MINNKDNGNGANMRNDINNSEYGENERFSEAVKTARARRKKKRKNTAVFTAAVCVLAAAIFGAAAVIGRGVASLSGAGQGDGGHYSDVSNTLEEPLYDYENEELRGVWIASVININFPSKPGLSQNELKAELDDILKNTAEAGLNAVFFQVRPTSDALYPSEIFPHSKYLSGEQGKAPDGDFDCLAYLLEKAGERGIDVHAWVNPYRVTMYESDEQGLSHDNPAVLHPEYTVKYADGKTYYNPGLPEVRQLIVDGVSELAENYPTLAGIHFDDYFYPYPASGAEFDDASAYELYGNGENIADWRRNNVNELVKASYEAIKKINPDIKFGVSPFGIWANSGSDTPVDGSTSSGLEAYSALYCDALAWVEGGYVDYLVPQIYWSFATSAAPFDNIARWWNAQLDGTDVDFYIGHAAYKVGDYAENEIGIQVEFARNLLTYRGSVFYGYEDIKNNSSGLKDKLAELNKYPIRYAGSSENSGVKVYTPTNNYVSASPTVTLAGISDVKYPLSVNGKKISRTKDGYFSLYSNITAGINVFTLEQNGIKTTHNINYKTTYNGTSQPSAAVLPSMAVTDVVPSTEAWIMTGDTLKISCVAPAGSTVTAKIGGMSLTLKPTLNKSAVSKYVKEIYVGEITPSAFAGETETATLGTLMITAEKDGEKASAQGGLIKQMGAHAPVFAEVVNDYSHLKISTTSSFYSDYTPASVGMRDYVRGLSGSYYQLAFGGYVSADNVKIVEGITLNENKIFSVNVRVNGTDTSNNKNNFTDVVFECLENVPINTETSAGKIAVTFYNTDSSLLPEPSVSANPLVSSVKASVVDETTAVYTINLKNEFNVYGYNAVYENGNIVIRMNNPQSLSDDPNKPLSGKTIVVDAGHGGTDTGALGCGDVNEAKLNFEIASYLQKELTALGADVLMTRNSDSETVSLEERMEFLNNANPDLAISVHQNSIDSSSNAQKIRGYLGLYGTEAGKLLAKTVSSRVSSELNRYERPYAYQMLAVARNHRFPSTLCEMCFISNIEEYQWSVTEGNTQRSAKALALGIVDYYKAQEEYLAY